MATLVAERLTKEIDGRPILRDVSLALEAGESLTLFGPNGSGKSTLLNLLSTLWRPSSGRILWRGQDVRSVRRDFRRRVGYVGHEPLLYLEWSGRANLRFFGGLYGLSDLDARVDALLEEVGLTYFADEEVQIYSRGMTQRLTLARALIHEPELLLLDEPFTGLDTRTVRQLVARLEAERARGTTIVLTTHDLALGYEVATRIAFLERGVLRLVDCPTFEALETAYAEMMLKAQSPGEGPSLASRSGSGE